MFTRPIDDETFELDLTPEPEFELDLTPEIVEPEFAFDLTDAK